MSAPPTSLHVYGLSLSLPYKNAWSRTNLESRDNPEYSPEPSYIRFEGQ